MTYSIKTEQFEGPLDLLLDLIEKEDIDITRISLAKITDEYIEYINKREDISLYNLTNFLSIAAKLILLKSHALLPLLQLDDEEESDIRELERQLEALKVFKDNSEIFENFFLNRKSSYGNEGIWGEQSHFCPPKDISTDILYTAFLSSLQSIPRLESLEEKIVSDIISLEERIEAIQKDVQKRATVAFSEITANAKDKNEVVVSFLALLELVKQKIVVARQNKIFDDILLHNEKV